MELTANDNFFINEPQNLRNNFFNKNHLVELLNKAHNDTHNNIKTANIINNNSNINSDKKTLLMNGTSFRYSYTKKKQLRASTGTPISMPASASGSLVNRLEILCQATYNSNDLNVTKSAVDTLISAANSGCCFLEKYIVILVNFCTKHMIHPAAGMDEKIDELLSKVLSVEFDRQQMTENLRRPEYKLNSVKQIVQLLQKCQHMLDYREQKAVDWLFVVLDAYFVELATSDETSDIIDQISAHINFQCALLQKAEMSKSFLKTVIDYCNSMRSNSATPNTNSDNPLRHKEPPYYYIERLEF